MTMNETIRKSILKLINDETVETLISVKEDLDRQYRSFLSSSPDFAMGIHHAMKRVDDKINSLTK